MYNLMNIIAHRGACAYAPENTLSAFKAAYELGSRWVEFDVMLSKDGHAMVFHDDTLNRTTNGKGLFSETSYDVLKTLDAGSWFSKKFANEKIMDFSQLLQWLVAHDMQANIEIKPYKNNIEETTIKVLTQLNQFWPKNRALPLISSFELESLFLCANIAPEFPIGFLLYDWRDDWLKVARKLSCRSVHLSRKIAKPKYINAIKQEGYLVYVYTINNLSDAKKLFTYGVDGIFSDYPDLDA